MMMRNLYFLLLIGAAIGLPACYEPVTGCLDRAALNFDLDADEACPDNCCTYPELTLEVLNRWGEDGPAVTSEELYSTGSQSFFLDRLRFYWSEPQLIRADGTTVDPQDSVEVDLRSGADTLMTFVPDGILLVDATQTRSRRSVGTFRPEGEFIVLRVRLGLADLYRGVLPGSLSSGHPLAFQPGRLYFGPDTGYAQLKLAFTPEGAVDSTTVVAFPTATPLLIDIPVPGVAALPPGSNITVVIEADYEALFSGLDLKADPRTLGEAIVARLPQIFRIVDVLAGG
jgi:hypothetical protein